MSTTMTCDHCGQPVDRREAVRIDVIMPSHMVLIMRGEGSLKERAKAAEDAAAHIRDNPDLHYDLHEQCYVDTLKAHVAAIGSPLP